MLQFLLKRFAQSAVVLIVMSLLIFVAVHAVGNPVEMYVRGDADFAEKERATVALGLDKSFWEQYRLFLVNAARGNLGNSFVYGRPAVDVILEKLPATMELAMVAMLLSILLGIPIGLLAGIRPRSWWSQFIRAGSILGFSLPAFWVGLMLVMVFAVTLGWLPAGGRGETVDVFGWGSGLLSLDGWRHMLLPAVNLAIFKISLIARLTYAGTIDAMASDYVRFARARGVPLWRIVWVHVLKNILIPIVTVLGLELGSLIAFAVVTETVFAWPGMGKLIIDSIRVLDRPVIVNYLLFTVTMFIVINLVVDLMYSILDPRIRHGHAD